METEGKKKCWGTLQREAGLQLKCCRYGLKSDDAVVFKKDNNS